METMKTAEELLKEKGITPETVHHNYAYVYRVACDLIGEAIKISYKKAMRWRDPKEELPDEGVIVFVKILSSCEAGDEILYTSSSVRNDFYHSADADPFGCEGYYPSGNGGRVRATVIGWRPIE